jgi:hypothetical protein
LLIIRPLESGRLGVLEIRRPGRQTVDVEESRVEYPVSFGRIINVVAAFEWAVVVVRIEKVYQ